MLLCSLVWEAMDVTKDGVMASDYGAENAWEVCAIHNIYIILQKVTHKILLKQLCDIIVAQRRMQIGAALFN